jgi:hypothetical protein
MAKATVYGQEIEGPYGKDGYEQDWGKNKNFAGWDFLWLAKQGVIQKQRAERDLIYKTYLDMFRTAPGARFSETIIGKPSQSSGLVSRGNSQAQAINQMGAALNVPNLMRGAIGD